MTNLNVRPKTYKRLDELRVTDKGKVSFDTLINYLMDKNSGRK